MRVSRRKPGELGEHRVSQSLVEASRLKIESPKPHSHATPVDGFSFSGDHQFAAEPRCNARWSSSRRSGGRDLYDYRSRGDVLRRNGIERTCHIADEVIR